MQSPSEEQIRKDIQWDDSYGRPCKDLDEKEIVVFAELDYFRFGDHLSQCLAPKVFEYEIV